MRLAKPLWIAAVILCSHTLLSAQSTWHVVKTLPIGGPGGMDYITIDPASHHLYVTRSTHTQVIDPASGKVIADIPGQQRSHGVALVPKLGRGFITDGGGKGAIVVFDLKTNATLGTIAAVPDADGIIYDAFTNRILVSAGDSNALLTLDPNIDPKTGKIDTPIALGGAPEFLATDGAGKAFVNLEDKDQVAVVDLKARKVIARWPVAPGGHPVGMAIDRNRHHLILGCRNPQKMIVLSTETGKVLAGLPIGQGVDADAFHNGQLFASTGDGAMTVAAETAPGKFEVVQSVQTRIGAKTMGIDPSTSTIYLPTMEFEPQAPGATGRRTPKPDSFMIVVVAK